jgi:hypothetical protein
MLITNKKFQNRGYNEQKLRFKQFLHFNNILI